MRREFFLPKASESKNMGGVDSVVLTTSWQVFPLSIVRMGSEITISFVNFETWITKPYLRY
jgi:hypothetical protein